MTMILGGDTFKIIINPNTPKTPLDPGGRSVIRRSACYEKLYYKIKITIA